MTLTTNFLCWLGATRDSIGLAWAKYIGLCVALAPMAVDLAKPPYNFPTWLVRTIQITALFVSVSTAQHRTSDLPGDFRR